MKLVVLKKHLGGQILRKIENPKKKKIFLGSTKTDECEAIRRITHDVGVNESWAWAHFFLIIIVGMIFAIMFAFNIKPGIYSLFFS